MKLQVTSWTNCVNYDRGDLKNLGAQKKYLVLWKEFEGFEGVLKDVFLKLSKADMRHWFLRGIGFRRTIEHQSPRCVEYSLHHSYCGQKCEYPFHICISGCIPQMMICEPNKFCCGVFGACSGGPLALPCACWRTVCLEFMVPELNIGKEKSNFR